jgi:pseudouridine-5'-phosphate glycosidase
MNKFLYSSPVKKALQNESAIVALESTVITHGLPRPENFKVASAMENEVLSEGAVPATICLLKGNIHIGVSKAELADLAENKNSKKISQKDIAFCISNKLSGGTTVAGTMTIAHTLGIKVFATGGIGGVHRGNSFDISADIPTLAQIPMIVVCSGAKSILDLPATRERLETFGIPVLGYKTMKFPAFYSSSSGLYVDQKVENEHEIISIARNHWNFGLSSALLVTVPPPKDLAIPAKEISLQIEAALADAAKENIHGPKVTPFLLEKVSKHTKGKSKRVNIALLKNNARIAAKIALALSSTKDS